MNWWKSVFTYQCPRCRQTSLFKKPFELSKPLAMNDSCEVCGQKFEPEPGFYFGAMFISYILSGWIYVLLALMLVFGFGWTFNSAMVVVLIFAALTFFKLVRFSRSIWIHLMVKYDPQYVKK